MGASCTSSYCVKSDLRHCQTVSAEARQANYDSFWAMSSWDDRKVLVKSLVHATEIKQKSGGQNSRRKRSYNYFLKVNDQSIQVCATMFCSTLGISKRTILSWLAPAEAVPEQGQMVNEDGAGTSTSNDGGDPEQNFKCRSPKTGLRAVIITVDQKFLESWLLDLPTVPSHYCRNIPAYANKRFLYAGTKLSHLYTQYVAASGEAGRRSVSYTVFTTTARKLNISVFVPRKDQCDICVSAKHGNVEPRTYASHIKSKQEAREEKHKDETEADDTVSVWTMDVQAVLLCPKTNASAMYYKTKLQVHNLTFYNKKTQEGFCYVWDETQGDLNSDTFAYLHYTHFHKYLESHPEVKTIIVWSDGCGYQNKNNTVSNSFLHLSMEKNVTIVQKYLTKGHTQMECDSMHSTIERQIRGNVYTPNDYAALMLNARRNPFPYIVEELIFSDFEKLSAEYLSSIRPGRVAGDATVSDIRGLLYEPQGVVHFKLKFSDGWEALPQRINKRVTPVWVQRFSSRLSIKQRKFQDLQALKVVLPKNKHSFFDNLPHL